MKSAQGVRETRKPEKAYLIAMGDMNYLKINENYLQKADAEKF